MWFLQNRISVQFHIDTVRLRRKLLWTPKINSLFNLKSFKVYIHIYYFSYLDVSSKISVSRGSTRSSFSGLQAGALDQHCCCGSKALAALHNPQHRQLMKIKKPKTNQWHSGGNRKQVLCMCTDTHPNPPVLLEPPGPRWMLLPHPSLCQDV